MGSFARRLHNLRVAAHRPQLAFQYAAWAIQTAFHKDGARRVIAGITLTGFNGFSEYHSVARGLSRGEIEFLRNHQFGTGAVIDVGANLGLFSLVAASLLPGHRVVALEPGPTVFPALRKNVARNAPRVECYQVAACDFNGTVDFLVREDARANASLAATTLSRGSAVSVPCTTLDRFVSEAGISAISLLKVDVEGFEAAVFKGAHEVLSRIRPNAIYFEICPTLARGAGFEPDEAARALSALQYRLFRICGDGGLQGARLEDIPGITHENWIALPA